MNTKEILKTIQDDCKDLDHHLLEAVSTEKISKLKEEIFYARRKADQVVTKLSELFTELRRM